MEVTVSGPDISVSGSSIKVEIGQSVVLKGPQGDPGPSNVITESAGTNLSVGAVADGQFLKRVGTAVVGAAAASAAADVTFSDGVSPVLGAGDVQAAIDAIKVFLRQRDTLFGDGGDGNLTLSSGTNTQQERPVYYGNVTLSGTGVWRVGGYPVYINGTLDLTSAQAAAITYLTSTNGNNASSSVGASGGSITNAIQRVLGGSAAGSAGGNGSTTTGGLGAAAAVGTALGGLSTAGGAGGAGSGGAGGAARSPTSSPSFVYRMRSLITSIPPAFINATPAIGMFASGMPGSGGSAGGGNGSSSGGGGGGGGSCPTNIMIFARRVVVGPSTPGGVITINGGNGGNGFSTATSNAGGGGGGAGAGGPLVYIVAGEIVGGPVSGAIVANGGNGGNGGNGNGTGIGGSGGTGGNGGQITLINLSTGVITNVLGAAGSAGNAGSGTTGGTGGAGGTCSVDL